MVPGAAGHVVIAMEIAVGEDVQPGAVLVAEHGGEGVLKLLAVAHIHHAAIQGPAPHAEVKPTRAGPGTSNGTRQDGTSSNREHGFT
jgi:hypothetical protein